MPDRYLTGTGGAALDHGWSSGLILRDRGLPPEVVEAVSRHVLDTVTDADRRPVSWYDKLVFYSDKLAGCTFMTLEERLTDVKDRHPAAAAAVRAKARQARAIETEVLEAARLQADELMRLGHPAVLARDGPFGTRR